MDRLLAMQTFVRVVETGSFSAVAREQNTTQSAISKQVAALEKYLAVRLLTRTTRSLALTNEGERYFEETRRLLGEIGEAEAHLRQSEKAFNGWLRVATSVGFGLRVLMPHVHAFLKAHPDLRVDLKLDDGLVDLVEQGIDVAVRIGQLSDSSLVARRIATSRRILLASKRYLDKLPPHLAPPRIPDDLHQHACIVYTGLSTSNNWEFGTADGSSVSVRVQGPLQTNSSEVLRASILGDLGIGYVPDWLFNDVLSSGEVVPLMTNWNTQPIPIHLVSPAQRSRSMKVRAFGDHVANALTSGAH